MTEEDAKGKVLKVIQDVKPPGKTTSEVSRKAGVGWETGDKYLRALEKERKVKSAEVSGTTIWWWVG